MQLPAQNVESSFASGLSADLYATVQVIMFLALGFAATRGSQLWYHATSMKKVLVKKIEEADAVCESVEQTDLGCEEESPMSKKKTSQARQTNAQQRKKTRQGKGRVIEVVNEPWEPTSVQSTQVQSPEQPLVAEEAAVPRESYQAVCKDSGDAESTEVTTSRPDKDDVASDRVAKMLAKKMDRKTRKAKAQSREYVQVEIQSPKPSTASGESGSSPPDKQQESIKDAADAVEASDPSVQDSVPQENAKVADSIGNPAEETVAVIEEGTNDMEKCGTRIAGKTSDYVESTEGSSDVPSNVNFDDIESDTDSEMGEANHILQQDLPVESEMQNAPVLWCSVPQSPTSVKDFDSPYAAMMPQIEGWMAMTVPAKRAPPGAFDGLWKNSADEKILIEKSEIMFESGVAWDMTMLSLTNLSVNIEGQEYTAERDEYGQNLRWSDGDVWVFYGPAEPGEQPEQQVTAEELPQEFTCMMWEDACFLPMISPLVEAMPMSYNNQMIPQDAEKWELCWDWKKKGFCPRGAACDWYHPVPEEPLFCGTCEDASYPWPGMA